MDQQICSLCQIHLSPHPLALLPHGIALELLCWYGSVAVTKYHRKISLKEERKTSLVHSFKGFYPLSFGSIASGPVMRQDILCSKAAHAMMVRKEGE